MRRKDREMPEEFALAIVDKCEYATLATVGKDGSPYGIPISIVRDGKSIYFHCAREGKKIDNLRTQNQACLSCVGDTHVPKGMFTTEFESAVVMGSASEVTDEAEKIHGLRLLCQRHTPGNMAAFDAAIEKSLGRTAVWKVEIQEISGKRKKYDPSGKEMTFGRTE